MQQLKRKHRVLVIDNNRDSASLLAILLRAQGHQAELETDSHKAIEHIRQFVPGAILIEVAMPTISGYEVAKAIRKLPGFEKILIVGISADDNPEHRRLADEAGLDHTLFKPVEFATIQQLLTKHLE